MEAVAEASTYRQMLLMALAEVAEQSQRAARAERRIRQFMGIDPLHPENEVPRV